MDKVNLNTIKELVGTQYGDLTGVIQIDGHENITSIYKMCQDYSFDTDDIFIVGFGLGDSSLSTFSSRSQVYCSIYYLNKSEYGNSYDEIEQKIKSIDTLKLKKKSLLVEYTSLIKYIKRFDFLATTGLTSYANSLIIDEN